MSSTSRLPLPFGNCHCTYWPGCCCAPKSVRTRNRGPAVSLLPYCLCCGNSAPQWLHVGLEISVRFLFGAATFLCQKRPLRLLLTLPASFSKSIVWLLPEYESAWVLSQIFTSNVEVKKAWSSTPTPTYV